ncbi:normocyte-binding protein [Inconstantimicrobium porci]|nr:normocyte-binding protein [Inconstantimicrobium porci]MDD6770662.1 normocyte-binding protein [Inconstantimicrobium porci]
MKGKAMNLCEVDLINVYRKWKRNLGVFRCFFRSSPFVSLKTYDDFILDDFRDELSDNLINKVLNNYKDDYFTIIDLEFDEILNLSVKLNNEYNIKPILNVNLLFNDFGLIGTKRNISNLINCGLSLKEIKSSKYIMIIPYERYIENINLLQVEDKLNNQYELTDEDLPESETLKKLNYKGITIITKEKVKDDLMSYIEYMKKSIDVKLVRMD